MLPKLIHYRAPLESRFETRPDGSRLNPTNKNPGQPAGVLKLTGA